MSSDLSGFSLLERFRMEAETHTAAIETPKETPREGEAPAEPAPIDSPGGAPSPEPPGEPAVPDRVVRVTAESLTRLMGLAGEALVQTHRLRPLVDSLWRLRGRQTGL